MDLIPGINVGNGFRQLFDWGHNYDIFDNYTNSGRPDQQQINLPYGLSDNSNAPKPASKKSSNGVGNSSAPDTSVVSGASGGGLSSGPSYDPNVLGQYNTAIDTTQSALDRLGRQLGIARGNINSQYDTNLNELNSAKQQAQNSYNTSTTQNQQNYRGDKNQIADTASSGLRGLLRTLGAYGAGGSSDAMYVAPQAVAMQASQQRAGAGQNFSQNQQSLDTNWGNFQNEDKNDRRKLSDWRTQQLNSAQSQSDTTKQSLLSKLADLMGQRAAYQGGDYSKTAKPYIDQANALSSRIDDLAKINPTYNGTTPVYNAPTLDSYSVDNNNAVGIQNAAQSAANPYLSLLFNQRDKNQLGF